MRDDRRALSGDPGLRGIEPELWARAVAAGSRLLMLDYDGTIAPFRVSREEARPLPGVPELMERIALGGRTHLAIVSGRSIDELDRLLPAAPVHLVGEHGWEIRLRGERRVRYSLAPTARQALIRSAEAVRGFDWSHRVERKRRSLVLHVRGLGRELAESLERECRTLWQKTLIGGLLAIKRIDGGVELRALGQDKSTAVRALLEFERPDTLPVYIGDDETDEDAFQAVRGRGYGIRVGSDRRPSMATSQLDSPAEVRAFLERWALEVEGSVRRRGLR